MNWIAGKCVFSELPSIFSAGRFYYLYEDEHVALGKCAIQVLIPRTAQVLGSPTVSNGINFMNEVF